MRIVVAVVDAQGTWDIDVDLATGRANVFRAGVLRGYATWHGRAWRQVMPDDPRLLMALDLANPELEPFADALGRRPRARAIQRRDGE